MAEILDPQICRKTVGLHDASSLLLTRHAGSPALRTLSTTSVRGIPTREEQIVRLREEHFDVLVVGGGATGAGTALDAATRGMSTACIERGDFGCETSARSTKLLWAGIRYIGTGVAALFSRRLLTNPVATLQTFASEMEMVLAAHRTSPSGSPSSSPSTAGCSGPPCSATRFSP